MEIQWRLYGREIWWEGSGTVKLLFLIFFFLQFTNCLLLRAVKMCHFKIETPTPVTVMVGKVERYEILGNLTIIPKRWIVAVNKRFWLEMCRVFTTKINPENRRLFSVISINKRQKKKKNFGESRNILQITYCRCTYIMTLQWGGVDFFVTSPCDHLLWRFPNSAPWIPRGTSSPFHRHRNPYVFI